MAKKELTEKELSKVAGGEPIAGAVHIPTRGPASVGRDHQASLGAPAGPPHDHSVFERSSRPGLNVPTQPPALLHADNAVRDISGRVAGARPEDLEAHLNTLRAHLQDVQNYTGRLATSHESASELNAKVAQAREMKEKIADLMEQLTAAQAGHAATRSVETLQRDEATPGAHDAALTSLMGAEGRLIESRLSARRGIRGAQGDVEEAAARVRALEQRVAKRPTLQTELTQARVQLDAAQKELSARQNQLSKLPDGSRFSAVLNQRWADVDRLNTAPEAASGLNFAELKSQAEASIKHLESRIATLEASVRIVEATKNVLEGVQPAGSSLPGLRSELQTARRELAAEQERLQRLPTEVAVSERNLARYQADLASAHGSAVAPSVSMHVAEMDYIAGLLRELRRRPDKKRADALHRQLEALGKAVQKDIEARSFDVAGDQKPLKVLFLLQERLSNSLEQLSAVVARLSAEEKKVTQASRGRDQQGGDQQGRQSDRDRGADTLARGSKERRK